MGKPATNDVHLSSGPKEYLGMLEYKREDEAKLIQNLILDLKPRGVVVNMIPGLPAHILFMCVRYADSLNDANMLKSLMNSTINGIKQVVKSLVNPMIPQTSQRPNQQKNPSC
ncbi:hypothetical protein J1605_003983 [Eschrichtius robustus]|uniref:Uncharacterized protein n=1 Tax=Eschrichtius robustus TaxID=9764 RepID=A0AB34HKN0_ESCRO|nr:hypothetical protein J1605_003983 [Eschrichtius robustus]